MICTHRQPLDNLHASRAAAQNHKWKQQGISGSGELNGSYMQNLGKREKESEGRAEE